MNHRFDTDGSLVDQLYCGRDGNMEMDGAAVFDKVRTSIPPLIKSYLDSLEHRMAAYPTYLVPHPANLSMLKTLERSFPGETLHCIEEYGNQSMVGIATTLAAKREKIGRANVLLVGYGAGFCSALMPGYLWDTAQSQIVELSK